MGAIVTGRPTVDLDSALEALAEYAPDWLVGWVIVATAVTIIAKNLDWIPRSLRTIRTILKVLGLPERRGAVIERRRFCDSVVERLTQINKDERWQDRRYSELEAEVDAEGGTVGVLPFVQLLIGTYEQRREPSLSRAIRRSREKHILLEGDPGSGKSVALRHVALSIARRVAVSRRRKLAIPLYVSLKDFRPTERDRPVPTDLKQYILDYHAALDDNRQLAYLEHVFDERCASNGWIFLFDSFDEIPDVMAAVEVDDIIERYEQVMTAFLRSTNCRAILASRNYKGPRQLDWPRFTIAPLTEERREAVIRESGIDAEASDELKTQLPNAPSHVQVLAENPMFLGLLCEYVERHRKFPVFTQHVFKSYVASCLQHPRNLFGLTAKQVVDDAASIAYCMALQDNLGLSVRIEDLESALVRNELTVVDLRATIRALRRARLARAEHSSIDIEGPPFSFAHRRFQEYFATQYVIENPGIVPADQLLESGRWRETTVTLLQLQHEEATTPLVNEVARRLRQSRADVASIENLKSRRHEKPASAFAWPRRSLHLLALLNDGFAYRSRDRVPSAILKDAGDILTAANRNGLINDRRAALEVAGVVPLPVLVDLVSSAFISGSWWLRQIAFTQISKLHPLTTQLRKQILRSLLTHSINGVLSRNSLAIDAQLRSVDRPGALLTAKHVLQRLPVIDIIMHMVVAATILVNTEAAISDRLLVVVWVAASSVSLFLLRCTPDFTWSVERVRPPLIARLAHSASGATVVSLLFIGTRFALAVLFSGTFDILLLRTYLLTWAPAALVCIRSGFDRRLLLWLLPQTGFLIVTMRLLWTVVRQTSMRLRVIYFSVTLLASLLLLTLSIISPQSLDRTASIVLLIASGFGIVTFIAALIAVGARSLAFIIDIKKVVRLWRKPPRSYSAPELVRLIREYRSPGGAYRAIRVLRASGALNRPDVILALRDLLRASETWTRDHSIWRESETISTGLFGRRPPIVYTYVWCDQEAVKAYFKEAPKEARSRLRSLNADFWDEVGRTLKLEENRRTEADLLGGTAGA